MCFSSADASECVAGLGSDEVTKKTANDTQTKVVVGEEDFPDDGDTLAQPLPTLVEERTVSPQRARCAQKSLDCTPTLFSRTMWM
jgi:exo-beta-1,3-glucanase (GH17 family)